MATNTPDRMVTRQNRPDYLLLNDGFDDEALPEDYISEAQSEINSLTGIPSSEILPWESVSQTVISATTIPNSSSSNIPLYRSRKRSRPAPITNWLWDYLLLSGHPNQDIRCAYIDSKTRIQCAWKTTDSQHQTSTTNMQPHLEKHSIFSPHHLSGRTTQKEQPSILDLLAKKSLTPQQLLKKNLIHWIINDNKAVTTIER
ncbi:hypothetical protein TSTA_060750, partial [Talaromyces stipitatus ATCC 10500]